MINLLGSSKEDFNQLMRYMNYKKENDKNDVFFYIGSKQITKRTKIINKNNSPFRKLMSLDLK